MKFTVKKGMRYHAQVYLTGFEALASNEQIAQKLRDVGFSAISVSGVGSFRSVDATWLNSDKSADIPSEVTQIELIGSVEDGGGKAI